VSRERTAVRKINREFGKEITNRKGINILRHKVIRGVMKQVDNTVADIRSEDLSRNNKSQVPTSRTKPLLSFNEERKVLKPKITDDEKARRRKDVLKDLQVCDMLDLRNPQAVSEYAP
jgi:hypothetical protein